MFIQFTRKCPIEKADFDPFPPPKRAAKRINRSKEEHRFQKTANCADTVTDYYIIEQIRSSAAFFILQQPMRPKFDRQTMRCQRLHIEQEPEDKPDPPAVQTDSSDASILLHRKSDVFRLANSQEINNFATIASNMVIATNAYSVTKLLL